MTKPKKEKKKKEATFSKLTKEELSQINKTLNDKRQNYIQALHDYYRHLLTLRQMVLFYQRFEESVDKNVEIKDNYNLPMGAEEKKLEVQKQYIELRFFRAKVKSLLKDLITTWGVDEDKIERQYTKWFIGNEEIE